MAIDKISLHLIGPNSQHLSDNSEKILGRLIVTALYMEIGDCANLLQSLNDWEVEKIGQAAYKLHLLCDVIVED